MQVTEDAVQSVLAAANFLGVQPVVEACCQFLQDHMGPATCLRILALAARHGCHKLSAQVLNDTFQIVKGGGGGVGCECSIE